MSGKLIIFSAPSGSGKTTIVRHLLTKFPELAFSISACSRPMRAGEVDGESYYFLSADEFKKRIANDEFLEWEEVYENSFYGTLKSEIDRIWAQGKVVVFDVDVQGGLHLKKKFHDQALAIFVKTPSLAALEERLKSRDTETPESMAKRLAKAKEEIKTADQFDCILVNEDLNTALINAEKLVADFLNKH